VNESEIRDRVHRCYWDRDLNCATTMLRILSEHFEVPLAPQVIDSALGMHGAACFGAQCGLVEGALLFIGIAGRFRRLGDDRIRTLCHDYAARFTGRFGSLLCRDLRPGGFREDDPAHLCENITGEAVLFAGEFLSEPLTGSP